MSWLVGERSFNSRTPGGVRLLGYFGQKSANAVSIHAPREGCDPQGRKIPYQGYRVSIHAPREGCDVL